MNENIVLAIVLIVTGVVLLILLLYKVCKALSALEQLASGKDRSSASAKRKKIKTVLSDQISKKNAD